MKLPIGVDDYKNLIQASYDYVDKSLFIKAFLDESALVALITRPRRFGKTINMSMLYYFLSNRDAKINCLLFAGKKIETAQTNEHKNCIDFQGQYPVIFFTFKNIRPCNFEEAKQQIAFKMAELYNEYRYLLDSNILYQEEKAYIQRIIEKKASIVELQQSLKVLSEYLARHHDKKVIILLDEYDTPFHTAYLSKTPCHKELGDFMKVFLGAAFKGNEALEKGLLTGILRVSLMDLFSAANSIPVRSMLIPKYEEFFGFTESESFALIRHNAIGLPETAILTRLETARQWYNGYCIGETLLYNPWSLISYLDANCVPDIYWNATGEDSLLGKCLLNSSFNMKEHLTMLLNGDKLQVAIDERTIFADLTRNENAIWGLMLYAGYLKVTGDNGDPENREYFIAIPNLEIKQAYKKMIREWFLSIGDTAYQQLFNCLQIGNLTAFQELLEDYLDQTVSYHDLGKKTLEKVYHILFLGMFFSLSSKYIIDSNKEYGLGRYDIMLISKDNSKPSYIFELKSTNTPKKLATEAKKALEQISHCRYEARLKKEGIKKAYHIGIAFCGKEMRMVYT